MRCVNIYYYHFDNIIVTVINESAINTIVYIKMAVIAEVVVVACSLQASMQHAKRLLFSMRVREISFSSRRHNI